MPDYDTDIGNEVEVPIIVPASAVRQVLVTIVRYVIVALCGSAVAKLVGIDNLVELLTSDQVVQAIVGIIITAAVTAWGALKSKQNVTVQQRLAAKLPDRVARTA